MFRLYNCPRERVLQCNITRATACSPPGRNARPGRELRRGRPIRWATDSVRYISAYLDQTARLLSERVSEALVARRAVEVAHDRGTCSTSLPVPIALSFVRMSMKALGKT